MSGSMIVGRVLLPGLGIALAGTLAWQAWRGNNGESRCAVRLRVARRFHGPGIRHTGDNALARNEAATRRSRDDSGRGPRCGLSRRRGCRRRRAARVRSRAVLVQEKSSVRKGDLLIEFRGDAIRASAEEAVARVAQADAELAQIEQEQAGPIACLRNQPGSVEIKERLKGRWKHREGPPGRSRCGLSPDRGRIRPHPRSVADRRRGHLPRSEPRRDRNLGPPCSASSI